MDPSLVRVMNGLHSARSRRRLISRGHKKLFVAVKLRPGDVVRRYSRYTSEVICIYTVDIDYRYSRCTTAEVVCKYSKYNAEVVVCRYSRYTVDVVCRYSGYPAEMGCRYNRYTADVICRYSRKCDATQAHVRTRVGTGTRFCESRPGSWIPLTSRPVRYYLSLIVVSQ